MLLSKQILGAYMQDKKGFSGTWNFQIPIYYIWHVANILGWGRYPFRGASASFCGSSANFLKGQLLIAWILDVRMRYPETGWYEEHDYIAFASASFRREKTQKTFRGLPRLQSGTIFQVLWHNPAYHYVENKWRCSIEKRLNWKRVFHIQSFRDSKI